MLNSTIAQVFKALRGGQVVAVKIFHERRRGNLMSQASQGSMWRGCDDLRREVSLLRSLHDRNIVNFVGVAICVRLGLPHRVMHDPELLTAGCHLAGR